MRPRHESPLAGALSNELRLATAAVLPPGDLGSATAGTIHANPFGTRWDVDQSPIFGDSSPSLAHTAARADPADKLCTLVIRGLDDRFSSWTSRDTSTFVLNVDLQFITSRRDDDLIIVIICAITLARRGRELAAGSDRGGSSSRVTRSRASVGDFDVSLSASVVDIDVGFPLLNLAGRRRRRGWACYHES